MKTMQRFTVFGKNILAALTMSALVVGLSACQQKEGPAEHAGKEIDKAVDKTGKEINKAVDQTGKQIENAGKKIQDTAKDDKK